ncbi:MAG: hypothetical protein JO043_05985 [Candidatus Eremiobacteraeota bacterium]|nr:hypothetical protein [Candidatus Eremiobacteraeota bacterium]
MTNGKLDNTNASVANLSRPLREMDQRLKSLDVMRSDIHAMVNKISGSFLFRGVK